MLQGIDEIRRSGKHVHVAVLTLQHGGSQIANVRLIQLGLVVLCSDCLVFIFNDVICPFFRLVAQQCVCLIYKEMCYFLF